MINSKNILRTKTEKKHFKFLQVALGNLAPTMDDLRLFLQQNPYSTWYNFPIEPANLPKYYSNTSISYTTEVARQIGMIVRKSDEKNIEHSILIVGSRNGNNIIYNNLFYNEGTSESTSFSQENNEKVFHYNHMPDTNIMLCHTHANYGPMYCFISAGDMLFGITQSISLRAMSHKDDLSVVFSMAYNGSNGQAWIIPMIFSNTTSRIYRLY